MRDARHITRDVARHSLVAGNHACVVKTRFDKDTIDRLLAILWWDWLGQKITPTLPLLRALDLNALEALT